jgi:hypothetical protein
MSIWQPGPRPHWVRALNAISDPAWIQLEADELVDEAMQRTGLSDFGVDTWREGYEIFVRSAREESELSTVGRLILRNDILTWLVNRLEIEETFRRHPEIEEVPLEKPVFIVGLPRTGTSITHEVMGQDPASRIPLAWEAVHPCPPPETATYESDPRIERENLEERLWVDVVPEYDRMHELGAQIPVECVRITAHEFRSEELVGRQVVPSYAAWLAECDMTPAYTYYRRFLKLLSFKHRKERWVLKAPSHLGQLDPLLRVFPDARIIQTHRDPLKTLASVVSILYSTAYVRSDAVDPDAILGWFTGDTCLALLERAEAVRESGLLPAAQVHDLLYADMVENPIEAVGRAYAHFEMPFSEAARLKMRSYLASKPKGKHGDHSYEFEHTGFDLETERARFADYQARYGVPTEL